jgi:hypothetical protein
MWQTSIGAEHHRSHRTDGYRLPKGIHVFTHYLRQAGYHTSNVVTAAPGVRGTNKTDYNFTLDEKPFDGTDWNQRAPGQPFYAQVNFSEAHRVWRRDPINPVNPDRITPPPYYPNVPAVREDWAMYYDSIQQLDSGIGKILERLARENLLESTIIAFFGDNGRGFPRGKEYLYEGGIHTPLIVRVPQQFSIEGTGRGLVRKDLVSCIDLTVTTLELAGIEKPAHMSGISFFGPHQGSREYVFAARDRGDETPDRIRSVRDKRFKYIRNYHPEIPYPAANVDRDVEIPTLRVMRQMHEKGQLTPLQARFMAPTKPREEFFDLEKDPHETVNLADAPEQRKNLDRLRGALDRWIAETHDHGAIPEPRESIQTPDEIENRVQVAGWCTHNYSETRLLQANGRLAVHCSGKVNLVRRSYVCEGGSMELRFSLRTKTAPPRRFHWGSVTDFDNPKNWLPIEIAADGEPHESTVAFDAKGHLALLAFDFGPAEGNAEFDWIRLFRRTPAGNTMEAEWRFEGK